MANSKNRRKNGKVAKNDRVKRMRQMAAYDLRSLMVCNVVDRKEIDGERSEMIPRTCVYDRKLKKPIAITPLQEVALKRERWAWNIHLGIICRRQDGEVYIDKETNVQVKTEVLLTEMNNFVTDQLMELWGRANSLHTLTMYWIASPYDLDKEKMESIPLEAVLAPLWLFNVLGNMLTQYEIDNPEKPVYHYKTDDFSEMSRWFVSQHKYRAQLKDYAEIK